MKRLTLKLKYLFLVLIFIISCNSEEKADKELPETGSKKDNITIDIESITICGSENYADSKFPPTILIRMTITNEGEDSVAFFVKNFDQHTYRGGFFAVFDIDNQITHVELADFWSKNPLLIGPSDTIELTLTTFYDEKRPIPWKSGENSLQKFLENFNVIYFPNISLISQDTSILKYKIMPASTIYRTGNLKIYE